ncbi:MULTISPECIES: hypothetical protein [Cellulosimicrobium]|uniref:Uncharacterized protein n=1 Tax=Cellulosimicrobium funkei TaxID=264251 RepID=A0A4Y8QZW9_9MICO|nr:MULTISPECIES: hypothetical protein [Cellulosimicrobium]TFF05634.1 hypothetical protein E1O70_16695 [Cellulosimicrobium funkei]TGA69784.1 hypothetical protein EQW79_016575 [Cellulosimicrobium terreum]
MTVRAVVLPGTVLLVPGAAGAASVLGPVRDAALAALADLVADRLGVAAAPAVVVVAPGVEGTRGPARASLAAAGVADRWIDPAWAAATRPLDRPVAGTAASVALLALAGAGWTGPVDVVELGGAATRSAAGTSTETSLETSTETSSETSTEVGAATETALDAARELGAELAREGARLVVVHDPRAPLPQAVLDGFVAAAGAEAAPVATADEPDPAVAVRRYEVRAPAAAARPAGPVVSR